jgi:hypothetical protein
MDRKSINRDSGPVPPQPVSYTAQAGTDVFDR